MTLEFRKLHPTFGAEAGPVGLREARGESALDIGDRGSCDPVRAAQPA